MKRRDILSALVLTGGAVIGGAIVVPLALHSFSPLIQASPEEEWHELAPIDNFPLGKIITAVTKISSRSGSLNEIAVFVWRQSDTSFVIYSRSCTDLGCPLTYDPGSEWFFCPCHGGIFDKEGERRAGPPKEPMWRYAYRIRDGALEIDLRSVPAMA